MYPGYLTNQDAGGLPGPYHRRRDMGSSRKWSLLKQSACLAMARVHVP